MSFFREVPLAFEVASETDDKDALPLLRNAVVRRIENSHHDPIVKIVVGPARLVVLKALEMVEPRFLISRHQIWVTQLQPDVFQIAGKASASQSLHIFKNECPRLKIANSSNCLREHIALVEKSTVKAAERKWLARGAASYEVNSLAVLCEVECGSYCFLDNIPFAERHDEAFLIFTQSVACPFVFVDHGDRLEASL